MDGWMNQFKNNWVNEEKSPLLFRFYKSLIKIACSVRSTSRGSPLRAHEDTLHQRGGRRPARWVASSILKAPAHILERLSERPSCARELLGTNASQGESKTMQKPLDEVRLAGGTEVGSRRNFLRKKKYFSPSCFCYDCVTGRRKPGVRHAWRGCRASPRPTRSPISNFPEETRG